MKMKKLSQALLVSGACLFVGGFIYDVRFAGIPYQDPTPEMQVQYDHDAGIASKLMQPGLAAVGVGVVGFVARRFALKKESSETDRD